MTRPAAIQTTNLIKKYGKKEVLKGVNLSVPTGSLFGFLGPNGAGKTTTMNVVTGVLLPSDGEVFVLGEVMNPDNAALRKRIGVVHDSNGLFEQLSGEEHLFFSASVYGLNKKDIRNRVPELLDLLDLTDSAKEPISQYSHGMKKKIALACALIHDPDVLFLDEPFEGMDPISARFVMENLRALTSRSKTIFLTSHILEIVEKLCDEVAIIAGGRVAFQETMDELQQKTLQLQSGHSALELVFMSLCGEKENKILSWSR